MKKNQSINLSEGNIIKVLLMFTLPILVGQIFQNLYNSFDALIIGTYVNKEALAAVTSSSEISKFLVGFFTGLSTGAGVVFARYYGAKDIENLKKSIHSTAALSVILGVIMSVAGFIIAPWLLNLVDCKPDIYEYALVYLRIYFVGIVFLAIYNINSSILRAVGDSKRPLYFLIASSVTNIILDYLFVAVFHWGVNGVGIATVISEAVSVVLLMITLFKTNDVYRLEINRLTIDGDVIAEMLRMGLPAAIQTELTSFSNLFVQKYINGFTTAEIAGYGVGNKILGFVGLAASSMALALTSFVAQNRGAGKYDRAYKGIRYTLIFNLVYLRVLSVPIHFYGSSLIQIYNKDPEVVKYGTEMLNVMIPLYFTQVFVQIFSGAVRGFGKTMAVMVFSVIGVIGCRQLWLAVSMAYSHSFINIYLSSPIGWGSAAIMIMGYYFLVIKKKNPVK